MTTLREYLLQFSGEDLAEGWVIADITSYHVDVPTTMSVSDEPPPGSSVLRIGGEYARWDASTVVRYVWIIDDGENEL